MNRAAEICLFSVKDLRAAIFRRMRQLLFLPILIILFSCNNSAGVKKPLSQTSDNKTGLHTFLLEGDYTVEYLTNKKLTSVQQALLHKVTELIRSGKSNLGYLFQLQEGGKPAWDPAMGINRQEYGQLFSLFSDSEPVKMKGLIKIRRQCDRLGFEGQGRLSLLDSLVIDINKQSAIFKYYSLERVKDTIDLSGEDIPEGYTIDQYAYYKGPAGILGLTGLPESIELLVATLKPGNKRYLSIIVRPPMESENPFPEFITAILHN